MPDHLKLMVWPLASFLVEEMEARGWTCVDVAQRMPGDYGLNVGIVNLILAASSTGGPDTFGLGESVAVGLAEAFGISEELIVNLHKGWIENPEARQPFTCPEHLFDGVEFPAADPSIDARQTDDG